MFLKVGTAGLEQLISWLVPERPLTGSGSPGPVCSGPADASASILVSIVSMLTFELTHLVFRRH